MNLCREPSDRFRFDAASCFLWFLASTALSACGVGLCLDRCGVAGGGPGLVGTPKLLLSGLEGVSIRKNNCYPVTLSAVEAESVFASQGSIPVAISAPTGGVLYSSLTGCQTYDTSAEDSVFDLSPASTSVIFYFRSDSEGAVSLSASAGAEFEEVQQSATVEHEPYSAGADAEINAFYNFSDGKAILGGWFNSLNGTAAPYIAKLNEDGTIDTSFNPLLEGPDGGVYALGVQSDGKILVGGDYFNYGVRGPWLARALPDGRLDTSFATVGGGLQSAVYAMGVQSDDKVVVGGAFASYNGTSAPYVARLNSSGSLDTSFAPTGSGLNGIVYALTVLSDGKVVVGGDFTSYNATSRPYVARINSNGSLDTSFAPTGSGLSGTVRGLAVQADGKVIVGGTFTTYNAVARPYIARLNSDGSLDTTFVTTGTGFNTGIRAVGLQSDGKVFAGGFFTTYNGTTRGSIARLNSNGSLDTQFAPTGSGFDFAVLTVAPRSDWKVMVGGLFTTFATEAASQFTRLTYIGKLD